MKKVIPSYVSVLTLLLSSCGSMKTLQLSPQQMQMVSTRTFDADYDIVFKSALFLLASKGFIITNTDRESGSITAERKKDKGTSFWEILLTDATRRSYMTKVSLLISKMKEQGTEV